MYLYEEGSMLWDTGRRYADNALIGYTNGNGLIHIESQGDYRPDGKQQASGDYNVFQRKQEEIQKTTLDGAIFHK